MGVSEPGRCYERLGEPLGPLAYPFGHLEGRPRILATRNDRQSVDNDVHVVRLVIRIHSWRYYSEFWGTRAFQDPTDTTLHKCVVSY